MPSSSSDLKPTQECTGTIVEHAPKRDSKQGEKGVLKIHLDDNFNMFLKQSLKIFAKFIRKKSIIMCVYGTIVS